jgi:hypothetical protein
MNDGLNNEYEFVNTVKFRSNKNKRGNTGLRFKCGNRTELQVSGLGFNVCVAPSSVKLGVLEFTGMCGVGRELNN